MRNWLAAVAMGSMAMAGQVQAKDDRVAQGDTFGAWTVTCESGGNGQVACGLTQRIMRSADNRLIVDFVAALTPDMTEFLVARVPVGVFFPSGFSIGPQQQDQRLNFDWQVCNAELCEALLRLSPEVVTQLENQQEPVLAAYRPTRGGEALVFEISIAGLSDGLAALKQTLADN